MKNNKKITLSNEDMVIVNKISTFLSTEPIIDNGDITYNLDFKDDLFFWVDFSEKKVAALKTKKKLFSHVEFIANALGFEIIEVDSLDGHESELVTEISITLGINLNNEKKDQPMVRVKKDGVTQSNKI